MLNREEVIQAAIKEYGNSISVDFIDDAMNADSIEQAVDILVCDSYYWDNFGCEDF